MPRSLMEVFAGIPDPRKRRGKVYPLESILALAVVATLGGARHPAAVAQFAADRPDLAEALGFRADPARRPRRKRLTPGPVQLHNIFKALDAAAVEAALTAWVLEACGGELPEMSLALDGKTLRGSRRAADAATGSGSGSGALPGLHLLSVFAPDIGSALAQMAVPSKTNELKAAPELLARVPLEGVTVTADAMFAHRDVCRAVVEAGGDYLITVKANQPGLAADVAGAFAPAFSPDGGEAPGRGG